MLDDIKVPVRLKLSALWCSLMFCYVYGDYFELYQPGKLKEMLSGSTALGAATQGTLTVMASMMVIPSLMVALSIVLPASVSRWMNIVFGFIYSAIMAWAIRGSWHFYILLGLVEIALTLFIVWNAWKWPRQSSSQEPLHRSSTSP